jgi:hypothetical protein
MASLETLSAQLAELALPDLPTESEASDDGWEITYDLPRSRRNLMATDNGKEKHGETD